MQQRVYLVLLSAMLLTLPMVSATCSMNAGTRLRGNASVSAESPTASACCDLCNQTVANGGAWTFDTASLTCSCFPASSFTTEQRDFWISSVEVAAPVNPTCKSFNNTAVNGTVQCGTSNLQSAESCCTYCNTRCLGHTAWSYSAGATGPACYCYSNITTVTERSGWQSSVAKTSSAKSFNNTAANGTVQCGTSNVLSADACDTFCNSRCSGYLAWSYSDVMGPSCYCYSNITSVTERTGWQSSVSSTNTSSSKPSSTTATTATCQSFSDTAVNGTVQCGTSNVLSADACCTYCNSRCAGHTAWSYSDVMGPSCNCYSNITTVTERTGWRSSVSAVADDVIKALSVP